MKIRKVFLFLISYLSTAVVAAFIVLSLYPSPKQPEPPSQTITTPVNFRTPVSSYADAVNKAHNTVVNIFTTRILPPTQENSALALSDNQVTPGLQKRGTSLGSGVIVDTSGIILTNYHVIEDARQIRIVLASGEILQASIIGIDKDIDLAVLKTERGNLPAIHFDPDSRIRTGDIVLAIGNPYGVGQTVTQGIISATARHHLGINSFENFIQTDAAINPGNSGGALIDTRGNLIGISTAIFSKDGGSQGIGFAIPAALALGIKQQIMNNGNIEKGWLGMAGEDITPYFVQAYGLKVQHGILITRIMENSPAEKAGLKPGDIINRINNKSPVSSFEAVNIIATTRPGTKVILGGWRGSREFSLSVAIELRPETGTLQ